MAISWQYDRSATPRAFKMLLRQLGLKKAQAARYLGVSERTVHRYCDGEATIQAAEVLLLRSLLHHGEMPVVPKWPG